MPLAVGPLDRMVSDNVVVTTNGLANINLIDGFDVVIRRGVAITVGTPPQNMAFWPAPK